MNNRIINLTPHTIVVRLDNGTIMTFPSEGMARAGSHVETVGILNGIPLTKTSFGGIDGLPDRQDGVFFIVSRLVAEACPDRDDLLIVSETTRDENGRINGCKSLCLLNQ